MTDTRVIAVGAPPTFRYQVARAMQADPDSVEWVPTVSAAEEHLTGELAPHVMVLSPTIKEQDAFGMADYVSRSSPSTAILLVRERTVNMNGLLTTAMRAGIRDVIDLAKGGDELRQALERAISWSDNLRAAHGPGKIEGPEQRGTVISVFSSKGGTGKTFLATNLAVAIARETKEETGVIDLDLDLGDVFAYFGKESQHPLLDLLSAGEVPDPDQVKAIGTRVTDGVWAFGSPPDPAATTLSGEGAGKIIRAVRRTFPYTVVDATTDYSDPVLAAFDLSDSICLVSALDVVGIRHLSMAMDTLLSLGFPPERFRVILNRADSKVGLSPADVERVLKLRIDAMIPSSRLVPTSLNRGRPVVAEESRSEVAKAVAALASKLTTVPQPAGAKRRRFGRG